jgi:hypothetical protein
MFFMATRLSGKIATLIADRDGAFVGLDNDPSVGPKGNIWRLKIDHSNYNALYSLALAAAANRWKINIRIEGDDPINIEVDAAVKSFGVAF